jgi:hypothetical protein
MAGTAIRWAAFASATQFAVIPSFGDRIASALVYWQLTVPVVA